VKNAMKPTNIKQPRTFAILLAAASILSMPSQSFAAGKIKAKLGLSMTQYFGYANNDDTGTGDFSGFDVKSDTEVSFGGDVTLENGIQVGAEVILDGKQSDKQIKDTYLWTEGEFGRFEIGNTDNAAAKMHYAAPDVGFAVNDADIGDWIVNPISGGADSAFLSTYLYLGESRESKISWFSPRLSGVQ
jgi:outer membrane protein OmpU